MKIEIEITLEEYQSLLDVKRAYDTQPGNYKLRALLMRILKSVVVQSWIDQPRLRAMGS